MNEMNEKAFLCSCCEVQLTVEKSTKKKKKKTIEKNVDLMNLTDR